MALVQCPECKAEVSDRAASCPKCGYPIQTQAAPSAATGTAPPMSPPKRTSYPCPACKAVYPTREERDEHRFSAHPQPYGGRPVSPPVTYAAKVVCPHCHVTGHVTTRQLKVKKGVSGGKATGAILTGGFSLLATGLSRKVTVTEARCGNCGVTWTF